MDAKALLDEEPAFLSDLGGHAGAVYQVAPRIFALGPRCAPQIDVHGIL